MLCVALALTSCSLRPQVRLSDPQIVRVPGPARFAPLPEELTSATPTPAAPVPLCVDARGHVVLCNRQLDEMLGACESALKSCNSDKTALRALGAPDGHH